MTLEFVCSTIVEQSPRFLPKHFSFNVDGGRCDTCKGEGTVTIEMQFMADVVLSCEHCKGKRFKKEIREVLFADHSIDEILEMTVDDAIAFLKKQSSKTCQKTQSFTASWTWLCSPRAILFNPIRWRSPAH